jgi:uncharacterized protein DUF6629
MCFSADADLVAGIAVSAVGIDAIRRARGPEELPLAALPLVFGVHQLVEAFVWWGLEGKVPATRGDIAIWIYLAIAFVLPLWVPLAVRGVERSQRRRRVMSLLVGLGFVVTLILWGSIVRGPVDASIDGHYIAYAVAIPGGTATGLMYVVATCGALLAASDRWIRNYGVSNLVAVCGLAWLTVGGLTSLWCVWAAVTSVAIDLYLREGQRRPEVSLA